MRTTHHDKVIGPGHRLFGVTALSVGQRDHPPIDPTAIHTLADPGHRPGHTIPGDVRRAYRKVLPTPTTP
jgi:hypothetical protein